MTLRGNIERTDRHAVAGWVRDEASPDTPVSLEVAVDGLPVARVLANTYRQDLEQAGLGFGRHGFHQRLDGISPTAAHTITIRRETDGTHVPGSPIMVAASASFDADLETFLAETLPDADDEAELLRRAAFLAGQADRLLQLCADRHTGRVDRAGHRLFGARWAHRDPSAPEAAPRALVIDDMLPDFTRDAGSHAIVSHMRSLARLGYAVTFAPATMGGPPPAALAEAGIDCCCAPWTASVEEVLRRESGGFALIYLHRVGNTRYFPLIRHHQPRARVVYCVADLHHLRLQRQAEVEPRPELTEAAKRVQAAEFAAAHFADATITHSSFEAALLRQAVPSARVHLVPWSVPARPGPAPWQDRRHLAFIGSYGHAPNQDAAWWLIQEVMPLVRAQDPSIECLLVGSNMPAPLREVTAPGIRAVGPVEDLGALLNGLRLTVAPLLFGAGVKGKVLDSLAAGVPCACTPIAAEGIDLPTSLAATVASDAAGVAAAILRLHNDEAFHAACSAAGLAYVGSALSEDRLDGLMRSVTGRTAQTGG